MECGWSFCKQTLSFQCFWHLKIFLIIFSNQQIHSGEHWQIQVTNSGVQCMVPLQRRSNLWVWGENVKRWRSYRGRGGPLSTQTSISIIDECWSDHFRIHQWWMRVYEYIKLFNALQWFTIRKFIHYKMCMSNTLLSSLNILHGTMRFKF